MRERIIQGLVIKDGVIKVRKRFKITFLQKQIMSSKLFQSRQKLNYCSIEDFRAFIDKRQLQFNDYLNLLNYAYEVKRNAFIHYLQILTPRSNPLINAKLNNQILILELCRRGVLEEVQMAIKLGADVKVSNQDGNCLQNALLNDIKKGQRVQSFEIIRYLVKQFPKLVASTEELSLLPLAIKRNQWKTVQFLLENGANPHLINHQQQNLLHMVMQNYSKKWEKQVLKLREVLVEMGVDENKVSMGGRKPYEMCPGHIGKKIEEQGYLLKSVQKLRDGELGNRYKGNKNKSQQHNKGEKETGKGKQQTFLKGIENNRVVLKIDNKYDQLQIMKQADQILERYTGEKEKELKKKKGENDKAKNKIQAKNKVMTPEELKPYLEEDIKYETQLIEQHNHQQKQFFHTLIQKLTHKIKTQLGVDVKIFGSFATQLCLPQSDIDVVVIPKEGDGENNAFKLLQNIQTLLSKLKQEIDGIKFIKTASVPILKIQCTQYYKQKKIDITYQDEKHNGLQSVALIQDYLSIYPQLRSLTFILKKFIYSARLFDPYSGGISSYGLILMIVAYIQNDNRERKSKKQGPPPTVAELLIGFLRYYGFKMNYIGKQICVLEPVKAKEEMEAKQLDHQYEQPIYQGNIEMDIMYNEWQPRPRLYIMDPLNPQNNIGRATHKIREIKAAFEMAYVCIHTSKRCGRKKQCGSYRRIKCNAKVDMRYEGNKRPCCIIKRMLKSSSIISPS